MKTSSRDTPTRSVASLGDVFGAELAKIAASRVEEPAPLDRRGVVIDCTRSPVVVRVFSLDDMPS